MTTQTGHRTCATTEAKMPTVSEKNRNSIQKINPVIRSASHPEEPLRTNKRTKLVQVPTTHILNSEHIINDTEHLFINRCL